MPAVIQTWRTFWARPPLDRRRLLRAAWSSLRQQGWRQTLLRARQSTYLALDREAENERYTQWCRVHTPDAAALAAMASRIGAWADRPLLSILTPVYNTDPQWLLACAESVVAQIYPHWEWHVVDDGSSRPETAAALARVSELDTRITIHRLAENRGISHATNVALAAAAGEYVALLDHDDALLPHAAYRIVEHLNRGGGRPDVIYSDEDKLEADGRRTDAYFKPDWSPDLFLSNMYACHWLLARRSLVVEVGGFRSEFDFSQDYDLGLRLMERANRIDHVADVLYHWRKVPQSTAGAGTAKPTAHLAGRRALEDYLTRQGLSGHVEDAGPPGFFRIVCPPAIERAVTVIGEWCEQDRERLRAATRHVAIEFASSAALAPTDTLLFLDPAYEPAAPDWLRSMLDPLQRVGVGAVGAKLLRADGALEHIGLVLGLCGVAGRPLAGAPGDYPGYFGNALLIRTVSAVTGDCLLTRKALLMRAGIDAISGDAGGVDYGLRLRRLGCRVVFTPGAVLRRRRAAPLPAIDDRTADALRSRWGRALDHDPYYNKNLSRVAPDFRVAL